MKRRGFLYAMVLVLSLILLVIGMAFLGSRIGLYRGVQQANLAAQAEGIARYGIEDARVKLDRDVQFPPSLAVGQNNFSYGEDVLGSGGTRLGNYRVTLGMAYSKPPFSVVEIRSTGWVGPAGEATAQHTFVAYLDVSPTSPTYYTFLRWDDLGGP